MSTNGTRLRLAWLPILLTITYSSVAPAPAGAPASSNTQTHLADRGREMLADIREASRETERILAELETAEGEDQKILRRRLSEVRVDALDELGDLVQNVLAQDSAGLDTTEIRAELDPAMRRIASRGPEVALEQLALMRAMRDRLASDPPADLEVFEREYNKEGDWLDTIHRACLEHYERMQSLGLDGSALREYLEEALPRGADRLAGQLELSAEEAGTVRSRLATTPTDETLQTRLRVAQLRIDGTARSLSDNVALMKRIGLPTTRYQQVLIRATGDITTDVLDTRVALGLVQGWIGDVGDWLIENGPNLVFRALVFVFVLGVFWVLSRFVRRVVRRSVSSSKLNLSQLLQRMIVNFSGQLVFLFGLLMALSQVGVSLGPVLAGLGIAGFIVGFALQDTLGNFASGMMILIYRPFDIGDIVEAAGISGKVDRMNLVSTTILTFDNQTLVVPNNKIWGDVIRNVTAQRQRRVDMVFGISYGDDIPKTEKLLHDIVHSHPKVLSDPEPLIHLHTLGESSVDFIVRPWVATQDYWGVYWDITREVKLRFDAEDISIPFPQRDVHLFEEKRPA